jgi:hypothetical protein
MAWYGTLVLKHHSSLGIGGSYETFAGTLLAAAEERGRLTEGIWGPLRVYGVL